MKPLPSILMTLALVIIFIIAPPGVAFISIMSSAIWAALDAKKIEMAKYKVSGPGTPLAIGVAIALLWIVFYPWYLINRGKVIGGEAPLKELAGGTSKVPAPSLAMNASDTVTQLEKLARLKEQGILSETEFVAQKEKLLAGGG